MLEVKHQSILGEWTKLGKKNPGLAQIIWDLQVFVEDHFSKSVVITHLFRSGRYGFRGGHAVDRN